VITGVRGLSGPVDVEGTLQGESILGGVDTISICHLHASAEARRRSQTPNQRSLPSLPRSSRQSSRRSTPFPAQRNTLLSWIQPPPRSPLINGSSPRRAVERSPNAASLSPA
jgi:hypothetical protein